MIRRFGVIERDAVRYLARGASTLLPRKELSLVGEHNVSNALAAIALCFAIGIPIASLLEGLRQFKGLSHRVERVASRADGVEYFDDSKGDECRCDPGCTSRVGASRCSDSGWRWQRAGFHSAHRRVPYPRSSRGVDRAGLLR